MDVPDCPEGTELRCDQMIDCCPSCRCGKVLFMTNGITREWIILCWWSVSQQQFQECMLCKYSTTLKLSLYNLDLKCKSTCCCYFIFPIDVHCHLLKYLLLKLLCIASGRQLGYFFTALACIIKHLKEVLRSFWPRRVQHSPQRLVWTGSVHAAMLSSVCLWALWLWPLPSIDLGQKSKSEDLANWPQCGKTPSHV